MKTLVATTNRHKLEEIRSILSDADLQLISLDDLPAPISAPDENGDTFEANAILKATYYAQHSGFPTVADDSGLVVDALDGKPGVHSARWMGEDTPYPVKNQKLIELLSHVEPSGRTARFVCVAAMAWPDGRVVTARGEHLGRIHDEICGEGGFGYDPVFYSLEAGQTFGTLSAEQKNRFSHRGRAMTALRKAIVDGATKH